MMCVKKKKADIISRDTCARQLSKEVDWRRHRLWLPGI